MENYNPLSIEIKWQSFFEKKQIFKTKEYAPKEHAEFNNIDLNAPEVKEKTNFIELLKKAPKIFWQLGLVQFFSWFALFLWCKYR